MKLIVKIMEDENECRTHYEIVQEEGRCLFSAHDGEPEDNNLMRNFSDVLSLPKLLKIVHEAGLKNEPLEFEYQESPWE